MIKNIYITKPVLPNLDLVVKDLKKIWKSRILTNRGPYNIILEKKLAKFLNCENLSLVSNGTDALILGIKALNLKKNSEIITVSNSFVATANAIINSGCKPVFVDVDQTMNIDPLKIERSINKNTSAIMPVHLNGMPCCMKKINLIAKKYKLKVIEDAAQSILSKLDNKYVGNSNNLVCFSMHPTKNLGVLGDGGFISTNNKTLYKKLIIIRNHGLKKEDCKIIGRNSRLNEINSIIANIRLNYLFKDTKKKIQIANYYNKHLCKYIEKPNLKCCSKVQHTYHRYVIRVDSKIRNKLFKFLKKNKIEVKIHYKKNIHENYIYKKLYKANSLFKTSELSKKIISLPCNQFMNASMAEFVTKKINQFYETI